MPREMYKKKALANSKGMVYSITKTQRMADIVF